MKIEGSNSTASILSELSTKTNEKRVVPTKSDSIEISNTAKVYDNVNKFMNLGSNDRLELSQMNAAEKDEFLKMLSTTIKNGIVGYEVLEVKGKPEKHFVENEIGDQRIYGAKLYRKKGYYKD
jgi:hypothetical protein